MIPWKTQIASRGLVSEMREERELGSQRSALIARAFLGCTALEGIGGTMMSVRIRLYCGSRRRRSARSWPMKPAAPVMRMLGMMRMRGMKVDDSVEK